MVCVQKQGNKTLVSFTHTHTHTHTHSSIAHWHSARILSRQGTESQQEKSLKRTRATNPLQPSLPQLPPSSHLPSLSLLSSHTHIFSLVPLQSTPCFPLYHTSLQLRLVPTHHLNPKGAYSARKVPPCMGEATPPATLHPPSRPPVPTTVAVTPHTRRISSRTLVRRQAPFLSPTPAAIALWIVVLRLPLSVLTRALKIALQMEAFTVPSTQHSPPSPVITAPHCSQPHPKTTPPSFREPLGANWDTYIYYTTLRFENKLLPNSHALSRTVACVFPKTLHTNLEPVTMDRVSRTFLRICTTHSGTLNMFGGQFHTTHRKNDTLKQVCLIHASVIFILTQSLYATHTYHFALSNF